MSMPSSLLSTSDDLCYLQRLMPEIRMLPKIRRRKSPLPLCGCARSAEPLAWSHQLLTIKATVFILLSYHTHRIKTNPPRNTKYTTSLQCRAVPFPSQLYHGGYSDGWRWMALERRPLPRNITRTCMFGSRTNGCHTLPSGLE